MGQGLTENFWRKLHSLSGVIPVGVFLTFHLFLNYSATWGEASYNAASSFMMNLPFKIVLELFVIFIPLTFHAFYGVYLALKSKNNVNRYHFFRNWSFFFQRLTGFIAFFFVIWHVWETRVQVAFGSEAGFSMMHDIVSNPISLILYLIGIVSAVYHFTNGLWTFLITWGITVSPQSQKTFQYISIGAFILLSFIGIRAIFAFV